MKKDSMLSKANNEVVLKFSVFFNQLFVLLTLIVFGSMISLSVHAKTEESIIFPEENVENNSTQLSNNNPSTAESNDLPLMFSAADTLSQIPIESDQLLSENSAGSDIHPTQTSAVLNQQPTDLAQNRVNSINAFLSSQRNDLYFGHGSKTSADKTDGHAEISRK